jgi:hypothetical protein
MIVVCAFAYYFLADRMSGRPYRQQAVERRDTGAKKTLDQLATNPTQTPGVAPVLTTNSHKPRLNQIVWHSTKAGGTPAVPVKSASYSPVEPKDASLNTSATSEKTLRLELQTNDPNIRIIWFSHKRGNEGSPGESSKGF